MLLYYKLNLKLYLEEFKPFLFKKRFGFYYSLEFYNFFYLDELDNLFVDVLFKTSTISNLVDRYGIEQASIWNHLDNLTYIKIKDLKNKNTKC